MSSKFVYTPPAHKVLFIWGDAGSATGKYRLASKANLNKYIEVNVIQVVKKALNFYVSLSDRGNARFSRKAAEACAKFVRDQIRANAYSSMVPKISSDWAARKRHLKLAHQVGMATEQMVRNIVHFRTNIRDHALAETKHTGWVVGINQKADYSKDDETINRISHDIDLAKGRKLRANRTKRAAASDGKYNRSSADFQNAKLYWLEHGRSGTGSGTKKRKMQPPRPIYTKAVEDFIRTRFNFEDFVGQLKFDNRGHLSFKFKHHR